MNETDIYIGHIKIDTDKYEGHTPAPWKASNRWYRNGIDENNLGEVASFRTTWGVTLSEEPLDDGRKNQIGYHTMHIADAQLIADAPLLLEAYKQLVDFKELIEGELDSRGYETYTYCVKEIWGESE